MDTRTFRDFLPLAACIFALLSGAAAALSGFGTRWGWWHFSTGFAVMKGAAVGGLVAALSGAFIVIFIREQGRLHAVLAVAAVAAGVAVAGVPWSWLRDVKRLPMIHDITTDTEDPPRFVSLLALRKDAPNPAEYGGPDIAAKQHAAYPDVSPMVIPLQPDRAFNQALAAANKMGWRIVDANQREGRIEASDTTFWYGFIDDIVVRVRPGAGGSRVDVRSLSRVGLSDVGTNARRIGKFMKMLREE
jgi:uncharacterized protein (DUF1499 family)